MSQGSIYQKTTIMCCILALTVLFAFNSCKKGNEEIVEIEEVEVIDENDENDEEDENDENDENDEEDENDENEGDYDTYYPLSYYPVYPGSYWNYIVSNGDIFQVSVNDEYQLHSYSAGGGYLEESEPQFVPKLNNGQYIYGYQKVGNGGISVGEYLYTFLSEELNASTSTNTYEGDTFVIREFRTTAVDSTLVIDGVEYYPTIEVSYYYYPDFPGWDPQPGRKYYYTENIGLVKQINYYYADPGDPLIISSEFTLTDYYIN